MSAGRLVTFGEVLLRLSPPQVSECLFQTPMLRTWWGGAEANVAANASALGVSATHVTVLPDNAVGAQARRALQAEGVHCGEALTRAGRMGLYFLESGADARPLSVTYDRAGSAFAALAGNEFDWSRILAGASWFHVSGVSVALGDGPYACVRAAVDAANAAGVPVSLDLNYRPALWAGRDAKPLMQPLAERAQLLIGNPGAIDTMLGHVTAGAIPEPVDALRETAQVLHARYGCARIAITQRETLSASVHGWQAHLWDAATNSMHSAPRLAVSLVDRVGGGDAFAAALLAELMRGADAQTAVRFATAASALKLTVPGDFNRVTRAEVERMMSSST
jgi:2-dehydro-3-deoxygluconokinase